MTRKEEIEFAWLKKALQSNHQYDEKSFKEAVEWADKTMIEKTCEWLDKNKHLHKELSFGSLSTDWNKLIREFRKAMEE